MTVDLVALGPSEVEGALLLSEGRSVRVRARAEDEAALRAAGFVEGPSAIETFVKAPLGLEAYPRRYRKRLRLSLEAWGRASLSVRLLRVADFGLDRFVDEVYGPLFLRTSYGRGIAPHSADRLDAALGLAGGEALLALVAAGGGALAGAALLRPSPRDAARHALRGESPEGGCYEGLVYSLRDEFAPCRRALMVKLADAAAARGMGWLSLGRDLALCEEAYAGVMFEKMHIARGAVAGFDALRDMYRFRPREGERFVFFEWDGAARRVRPRNFGCATDRFSPFVSYFSGGPCPDF